MRLQNIFRPYYVFRPSQFVARVWRARRAIPSGRLPIRMPWGCALEVDPRDHIGRAVWHNGVYDLMVSEVLWRLAAPGATAVDVGANIGCMTSLLASRVGPTGRVIAFEPHPDVRGCLRRNVDLLGAGGSAAPVEVVGAALGDHAGTATLVTGEEFDENHGTAHIAAESDARPARGAHTVELRTLDDVLGDRSVDVVKVDVEGHEAAVFRGARELLRAGRLRHIVYEDNVGAASPVHAQLEAQGYHVFALGWRFGGPVMGERGTQLARADEAPSYLATIAPDEARTLLSPRGWKVLRAQ